MSRRERKLPKWLWNPEARLHVTKPVWTVMAAIIVLFALVGVAAAFGVIEGTLITVLARSLSLAAVGLLVWGRRRQRRNR